MSTHNTPNLNISWYFRNVSGTQISKQEWIFHYWDTTIILIKASLVLTTLNLHETHPISCPGVQAMGEYNSHLNTSSPLITPVLYSQTTFHTSPSRASYGASNVGTLPQPHLQIHSSYDFLPNTSPSHCPACRTTLIATRFRVAVICPIIQVPHCIRVFFYFVWFMFINHIFPFYYELCTYCNILDIYLS